MLQISNRFSPFFIVVLIFSSLLISEKSYANLEKYIEALELYKEKRFTASYKAFDRLVQTDFASFKYNFYLARSATMLGNIDEAIAIYERILIVHPGNTRSKLELGRLHFQQKSYGLAKSYFNEALKDKPPQGVVRNVRNFLAKIEKTENKSSLSAQVVVGIGHDSNITTTPAADSWFVPAFSATLDNISKPIQSNFHQETISVNHYYDAFEELGFALKNSFLFYSKSLPEENDYNILFARYAPALIFHVGKHKVETALEYSYMNYGGEPYLQSYGIAPKLIFKTPNNQAINTQLKVIKKHYLQQDKQAKDSILAEASINFIEKVSPKTTLSISSSLQQERKESGTLYDVDQDSLNLQLGLNYQISNDWSIGGSIGIKEVRYLDENPFFFSRREDSNRRFSINLTKKLSKDFAVQASFQRLDNLSNQEAYQYQKDLISVNLIKSFSQGD